MRCALGITCVLLAGLSLAACGGEGGGDPGAGSEGGPNPQPAFYLTAQSPAGLERRARAAGARFARSQGKGRAILVLDFGAARLRHGTHGVSLRGGTFFSNEEVAGAIRAAARGYHQAHRRGSVEIVYANSNAFLSRPGKRYTPFDQQIARQAGVAQARTVADMELPGVESVTVGGDIEPGYDVAGRPEVSIAMVAGANSVADRPYYDFGTAPCDAGRCGNGWTPRDICRVASGEGRAVLPEVYTESPEDQAGQWSEIQRRCGIEAFAGVSSSPAYGFEPHESWHRLRDETPAKVNPVIVVWPQAPG
jgi:hypothetical protein